MTEPMTEVRNIDNVAVDEENAPTPVLLKLPINAQHLVKHKLVVIYLRQLNH